MKKKGARADIKGRAMAWLFLLCGLLACLLWISTRPAFYAGYWARTPEALTRATFRVGDLTDMSVLFESIPRTLNGDLDAMRLLRIHDRAGREIDAFNALEMAHMADVAHLYHLARVVAMASGVVLLLLTVWAGWAARRGAGWKGIAKGAVRGVLDVGILAGLIALWAIMDFRSIFWAFHQVAFTNDLWLLNPETDLLVRMLPQSFFEAMISAIAVLWLCCILLWWAGWGLVCRCKRGKGTGG